MLALSFLNPFLLWGAGLASIPLIIHILNRRRFKTVRWAAMEFLLKAYKENRRRVRFEQLLLLLLRMAAVALLAFLLSRPSASADEFGPWQSRVHHVVLLDESGSMNESAQSGTSYGIAKRQLVDLVDKLARVARRNNDLLTVMRSGATTPDVNAQPVTLNLLAKVKDMTKPWRATPSRLELGKSLEALSDLKRKLGEDVDKTSFYVFTDFKSKDFIASGGKLDEAFVTGLRKLAPERILPTICSKSAGSNLAVTKLRLRGARCIRNQPAQFEVTVENQGQTSSSEVELGFSVDGASRKTRMIPALSAGGQHVEIFKTTIANDGHHWVEADLPRDRLPMDDRRVLAFPVVPSARVLLVDGDPGDSEERQETFYLSIALDPIGDGTTGLEVERVDDNEVAEREFTPFDLIVLANVATIDDETLARLEKYVAGGGGLMMFAGEQIDANTWNRLFWKDGKGLMPAPIGDIAGDSDKPDVIVVSATEHPMFENAQTAELIGKSLSIADVGRYVLTGGKDFDLKIGAVPEGSNVLLRLIDEAGPPLFVEKTFQQGRVGLMTTTADAAWTTWASNPSYLIVMRMAAEFFLRRENLRPFNVTGAAPVVMDLAAADYERDVRMTAARTDDEELITERGFTADLREDDADLLRLTATPEKGRCWPAAGAYKLTLRKVDTNEEARFFSVSTWESEGVVAQLDRRTFLSLLPQEMREKTTFLEVGSDSSALSDEGEFWRILAVLLLAALFIETFLAWRFGSR